MLTFIHWEMPAGRDPSSTSMTRLRAAGAVLSIKTDQHSDYIVLVSDLLADIRDVGHIGDFLMVFNTVCTGLSMIQISVSQIVLFPFITSLNWGWN
jgi:hypothetical protein